MRKLFTFRAFSLALISLVLATNTSHASTYDRDVVTTEQSRKVSGKVVDEGNLPMAGVLVQVDGTTTGAVTDHNGDFQINNVKEDATLIFTFVGYKTVTMPAGNSNVNVTMEIDAVGVEEVVVVGFGSQKKVNLTGSVAIADAEVFESRPVQNAAQALQGVVPGLNISQTSGNLDSSASINIRGMTTIGDGSSGEPLILIDGMEGDISTINPQDIESISVLKDAAASSIYGSRAPFGVILVTTKKGSVGKMTVNYNNSFRYATPMNLPQTADSYSFANYWNDGFTNLNQSVYFSEEHMQRILDYQNGVISTVNLVSTDNPTVWASGYPNGNDNIDYYDMLYKDWVFTQEHTFSINGGNERQQIYASANYLDQGGFLNFGEDSYSRFATNIKATTKVFDFLDFTYNVKFQREDYSRPSSLTDDTNNKLGRQAWPTLPLYDDNGYLAYQNPFLALRDGGTDNTRTDQMYQQARFVATPIEGWNITAEMNFKTESVRNHGSFSKSVATPPKQAIFQFDKRKTLKI